MQGTLIRRSGSAQPRFMVHSPCSAPRLRSSHRGSLRPVGSMRSLAVAGTMASAPLMQPCTEEGTQPRPQLQNAGATPCLLEEIQEVDGRIVQLVPGGPEPSVSAAELATLGIVYILPELLCGHMEAGTQDMIVVDLRTFDYAGGHIRGSMQIPSTGLVVRTDEVITLLAEYSVVIFHCMLSKHRAPHCARIYKRRLMELGRQQHVAILEGGYGKWRMLYSGSSLIEDETHDYEEAVQQHTLGLALGQQFIASLPKPS